MDLDQRFEEIDRRLAALENARAPRAIPAATGADDFWALNRLQEELAADGVTNGGVLFTGSVRLPTEEQYGWQMAFTTDALLDGEITEAAESLAALGNPVRLRLLREILGGRRTAAELTELDGLGTSGQIYHHLRQLTAAGWLHTAGRGRYAVPGGRVVPLLIALATTRR
ncbi:ArsR/SmtB family transcription factor [Nocardia sp. NPDC127526]|uniref:ArsR/SmtB family transcription factor n=1 Tax=Nocardia sp. NPDC127526 TaxID=3345393 RepID=UPI00363FD3E9